MEEIQGVSQALIQHLSHAAKRHDAWYLKRLPEAKRHAMVACFLLETRKTVLDHLIEMNDQHLTKLIGDCRKAAEEQQRHYWKLTREGQDLLVGSVEWMLEQRQPTEAWETLLERTPAVELRRACVHYRESRRLEQTGYVGVLRERLRWQVRPYLPEFLQLPFRAEAGATGLQQALASASIYFRDKKLPSQTTPVEFLPAAFRRQLFDADGKVVPEVWELGLAVAVRDAVRARELYLSGSRRYISFSNNGLQRRAVGTGATTHLWPAFCKSRLRCVPGSDAARTGPASRTDGKRTTGQSLRQHQGWPAETIEGQGRSGTGKRQTAPARD
jgi:hypothetical protein